MATRPLSGIRILDVTQAWTGPLATMMLADAGAQVIKVEPKDGGDHTRFWALASAGGLSPHFLSANRNKRSITLDLKKPRGRELLLQMAREADVFVENYRPGVADRLGIGYENIRQLNPHVIYCSISGFGQDGPYRERAAYDFIMQGEGGIISVTGPEGGQGVKAGIPMADMMSGQVAAFSIATALVPPREQRGAYLDISMLDTLVSAMGFHLISYLLTGKVGRPMGNASPIIAPYETIRTATIDISLAVLTDKQWHDFCKIMGLEHLLEDPLYDTAGKRLGLREGLIATIEALTTTRPAEHWLEQFLAAGIPCGAVNTVAQLMDHPQVRARQMLMDFPDVHGRPLTLPGIPWRVPGAQAGPHTPPPQLGEHTDQVLQEFGYTPADIAALRAEEVI